MEMTLSIIVPLYNEEGSILEVLHRIAQVHLLQGVHKEVLIINDGSTDNSESLVQAFLETRPDLDIRYFSLDRNRGKGAAIHYGIQEARGDLIIIQDADREYDPAEYNILLRPIVNGRADVVYGSRFMGGRPHRVLFFWHRIGNHFITFLCNAFANLNLTDVETGYKMFKSELLKSIRLKEQRFGFEPEVTLKLSRIPGIRIYEVGISYHGRTYEEGKKIGFRDGFRAIFCILKYGIFSKS